MESANSDPPPGGGPVLAEIKQPRVNSPSVPDAAHQEATVQSETEADDIVFTGRDENTRDSSQEAEEEAINPESSTATPSAPSQQPTTLTPQEHIASIRARQHLDDASNGEEDFVVRALGT